MKTVCSLIPWVVVVAVLAAWVTPVSAVLPGKSIKPEPYSMESASNTKLDSATMGMSLQKLERILRELSQEMADVEMVWMKEARESERVRMANRVEAGYALADMEDTWMQSENWPVLKSKGTPIVHLSPIPMLKTPWEQKMDIAPGGVLRAIEWGSRNLASMEADWMAQLHDPGRTPFDRVLMTQNEAMADLEAEWMR